MTEEIQYLDDELNELCQEIRGGIEDLNGNKRQTADKKSERIIHLTERINRAKQVYHSFKVELRELSRDELKEYEQKGKEHNNNITKLVNDLNWAKQNSEKSELMDGASKKKPGDDDFDGENSDVKEILAEGARIQDQSSASLQRSKKLVASAEQIGTETAVQLKSQTEQLKNIYASVESGNVTSRLKSRFASHKSHRSSASEIKEVRKESTRKEGHRDNSRDRHRDSKDTTRRFKKGERKEAEQPADELHLEIKLVPEEDGVPLDAVAADVTKLPGALDAKMQELDEDNALRPTIVNLGPTWKKKWCESLLTGPTKSVLGEEEQRTEKNKAMDLLDALTRSGALPIEEASLHVVVAATHNFDLTLTDTVIQRNVNPIEKVERSVLIMASTVQGQPAADLVTAAELPRVTTYSPNLFTAPAIES
mmetsp:Transcript_31723/g.68563  ORF Transcript_31723/g.68563 Transcript_31723/m.68563 type:complete len:424 (+) Transcript_31723:63-1334(+)